MKSVLCTPEFKKQFDKFLRVRAVIGQKLDTFIRFRQEQPNNIAFNPDDSWFASGSPLQGFRHVHLHHGKCIVVYRTTAQSLNLYAMVDHDAEDAPSQLSRYLRSIKPTDLIPFYDEEAPVDVALATRTKTEIFDLAASDPDILRSALSGDPLLINYLSGSSHTSDEIYRAFGGKNAFDAFLKTTLARYGVREGVRPLRYYMTLIGSLFESEINS